MAYASNVVSIGDFQERRLENQKDAYNNQANRYDISAQLRARAELMKKNGLFDYNEKIVYVTSELNKRNEQNNPDFKMIWVIFGNAGDFIMSYGNLNNITKKYLAFVDVLYSYFKVDLPDKQKSESFMAVKIAAWELLTIWNHNEDEVGE